MELAFSIDRDGLVQDTHAKVYKELGDWVRGCYGKPLGEARGVGHKISDSNMTEYSVNLQAGTRFDRFQMIEDTRYGQRVHNWTIAAVNEDERPGSANATIVLARGQAIGIKRIVLLGRNITTSGRTSVRLTVTQAMAPPVLKQFAVFAPCYGPLPPLPSPPPPPPGPKSPLTCKTADKGNATASLPCKKYLEGNLCADRGSLIGEGQTETCIDACYNWCAKTADCTYFSIEAANK